MSPILGMPSWQFGTWIFLAVSTFTAIKHAVKLRNVVTPKFRLTFDREGGGIVDAIEKGFSSNEEGKPIPFQFGARYIRVTAQTLSKVSVRECFAIITKIERGPISGVGTFIQIEQPQPILVTSKPPPSMYSNMPNFFDFVVVSEKSGMRLVQNQPYTMDDSFKESGTYRFSINVYGEGGNQQSSIMVDVVWQGNWRTISASPSILLP